MLSNLSLAVENLIKALSVVLIRAQIADIDARLKELEMRQLGTVLIEDALGYQIE